MGGKYLRAYYLEDVLQGCISSAFAANADSTGLDHTVSLSLTAINANSVAITSTVLLCDLIVIHVGRTLGGL